MEGSHFAQDHRYKSSTEELNMKFKKQPDLQKEFEINNTQLLKQRKSSYTKNLTSKLESSGYLIIVLLFLTDDSLLLLLLRSFHLFTLTHPPATIPGSTQLLSQSAKRIFALKVLEMTCAISVFGVVLHSVWLSAYGTMGSFSTMEQFLNNKIELSQGYFAINFVGESLFQSQFKKWFYLMFIDVILFFVEFLLYYTNYLIITKLFETDSIKKYETPTDITHDSTFEEENAIVKEYDGYQGNILLFEIDPIATFKTVFNYERNLILTPEEQAASDSQTSLDTNVVMPGSYIRRFTDINNMV